VNPRQSAQVVAIGRVVLGAGLVLAPARVGSRWLGDLAGRPAVQSVMRGLGVRDLVIGMIALHTLDTPEVGPRWQRTCAVVDAVDALAALLAARDLPFGGAAGVALLGGAAAAAGFWQADQLGG
jgi:hypothetical protein